MIKSAIPFAADLPNKNIQILSDLLSAYSHGAKSPTYKQKLVEAESALEVQSVLLQVLCESWLTLIKESIAVTTAVNTDNTNIAFLGMLSSFKLNQQIFSHLTCEFDTPILNGVDALLWLNLKAFERLAQDLDDTDKKLPLCMVTLLFGFAAPIVKEEYAVGTQNLKKHLISYLQHMVGVLQQTYSAKYPDLVS